MAPKNLKTGTALTTAPATVVLPAATGDGVSREVSAADALRLGENVNNDAPGDLAADLVTRPIVAAAPVVEPANAGLGEHPALKGDQAGDAAIAHIAGADPLAILNTEESSAVDVARTAVPLNAALTETQAADPSALELAEEPVDIVVFDLSRPATEEDRVNLQLVLDHVQAAFPGFTLPGDARPVFSEKRSAVTGDAYLAREYVEVQNFATRSLLTDDAGVPSEWALDEKVIRARYPLTAALIDSSGSHREPILRVTSKAAGFRRGDIAHPDAPVEYPLLSLGPSQVEAILGEPMLVTDVI